MSSNSNSTEDERKNIVENEFTTSQLENVYKNYFREDLATLNIDKLSMRVPSCCARMSEWSVMFVCLC